MAKKYAWPVVFCLLTTCSHSSSEGGSEGGDSVNPGLVHSANQCPVLNGFYLVPNRPSATATIHKNPKGELIFDQGKGPSILINGQPQTLDGGDQVTGFCQENRIVLIQVGPGGNDRQTILPVNNGFTLLKQSSHEELTFVPLSNDAINTDVTAEIPTPFAHDSSQCPALAPGDYISPEAKADVWMDRSGTLVLQFDEDDPIWVNGKRQSSAKGLGKVVAGCVDQKIAILLTGEGDGAPLARMTLWVSDTGFALSSNTPNQQPGKYTKIK